jgi:hypothetical protein
VLKNSGSYSTNTERRSRVVNTAASYFKGSRVQISSRRPSILTDGFRGLNHFLQANAGIKLDHDRFLSHPFQ